MKKKHFLKKHFGSLTKFQIGAQPLFLIMIDGGIVSIPVLILSSAIGGSAGYLLDMSRRQKMTFNALSGQKLNAPEWAKKYFRKLEKDLIKACEQNDTEKKRDILSELQDLKAHIEIVDNEYNEIYYATKPGSMTNSAVRGSLINSKGQARFLKPLGPKPSPRGD